MTTSTRTTAGHDEPPRLAMLRALVRDIPDFPKPGILFRDLTPLMRNGPAMREVIDLLIGRVVHHRPELVIAIESRGFIFGAPVAAALGVGFVPVRKPGKLPHHTRRRTYALEYGDDALEIHADAIASGARVIVVDDLLATGGTAAATIDLARELGAQVACAAFVVELTLLRGRDRLSGVPVEALLPY